MSTSKHLIDTCVGVGDLIDALGDVNTTVPLLYFDLEGINLGRHGSVSIMQLLVYPANQIYLIDVHTLGEDAFRTPGKTGTTLKDILESESIPKVFFDVRNDSDALFHHFSIKLAGIQDLQLMELATRRVQLYRKYLFGLSKCVERELSLSMAESREWKDVKERGLNLFAPERGGSYEVFNIRPLPDAVVQYCIQDVQFMPKLWLRYHSKMADSWRVKVQEASRERVALSQTKSYNGNGQHMALAPASFQ
ncbi:ribonuclease H-like domain-containing protein [Bisporella sp. PMI_857]|nr:ribonuclease H-like domain-containing protein [Bisporella sp. PMI_857]